MALDTGALLRDTFLAAAQEQAATRPEVDLDLAREVLGEAATMLHNGLALDGLDDHDAAAAVTGLCASLVAPDPGAALRATAAATLENQGDLHDADAVSGTYLVAVRILQL